MPLRNKFHRVLLACVSLAFFQSFILVAVSHAQGNIELRMNEVKQDECAELQSVEVTVLNEAKRPLDRQAEIKMHDTQRNLDQWQTTSNESKSFFCTADFGVYELEVSAAGYLTEKKTVQVGKFIRTMEVEVILHKDPTAVELSGADATLPPKARKEVSRAIYDLKSEKLKDGQKELEHAAKLVPNNAQVNFLYGYLNFELKDYPKSESYLSRSVTLDPGKSQTLSLLGRIQLQLEQYPDAQKSLERAVAADPEDWMSHNLLADAYLRNKDYEKARQQAQFAIDKGHAPGTVAQLVLGEALANLGRDKESLDALNAFIQTNASNPAVPQVKNLIKQIQERKDSASGLSNTGDLTLAASEPSLPERAWGPPGIDDVQPTVAAGITCPSIQVLNATGDRVKQLVDNIGRFAAIEELNHQQLDKTGTPISHETRKFDYIATITENPPGYLGTTENRNTRYGIADLPDRFVTSGFISLALVFHPDMRDNFQMVCEGLGDWHGQATWLMHFRQRDDKPSRMADYVVGSTRYPMKLKGRAWISAKTYQIVHIESDLVDPLPRFPVQHQIVDYGPVHFAKRNVDLWLPQRVDIYLELNKHFYHREHSFDHFMLFSVESQDKTPPLKKSQLEQPPEVSPDRPAAASSFTGAEKHVQQ